VKTDSISIKENCDKLYTEMETDEDFENNFPISGVRLNNLMPDMIYYRRMNIFVTHLLFRLKHTIKENHDVVAELLAQNMMLFASICMNIFNISMDFYDKEESSQEEKNMHGRPIKRKKNWDKEIKKQTTPVIDTIKQIFVLAKEHQGGEESPLKGKLPAKRCRREIRGGSRKLSKKRSVTYRRRSRRRNTNKIS
jgi:hypothetical protein